MRDPEEILRALAGEAPDDDLPAPTDELLRAYREGRLTLEETRELDGLLARSAAGRRRLLELAGVDRSLPLRRVRRAVLDGAGGRSRTALRSAAAVAAMAAMAAGIVLAVLAVLPRHGALPAGLAYDVSARGLADVRSEGEEARGEARAYPGTPLRIHVRPRGEGAAGVSFALFRREGGALRRVREPEEVRLQSDRGSAAFTGAAARVLGSGAPGPHSVYVVAYVQEELPSLIELEPGQDPAAALRTGGRLVYPLTVILLRQEPQPEEGAR